MSRAAPDQLGPARARVASLWVILLAMALVMLTGTLLAAVDGVVHDRRGSVAELDPGIQSG